MTLPHQAAPAECHPAVTGPHTTNSYTVGPHSFPPPSRNRWSKRRTTKDFTTIGSKSFHRLIYGQGRRAALTFWTQIRIWIFFATACVAASPGQRPIPSVPWTSRQIAAARFFLSPAGIAQNWDIVALGKVSRTGDTYRTQDGDALALSWKGFLLLAHRVHQPKRPRPSIERERV